MNKKICGAILFSVIFIVGIFFVSVLVKSEQTPIIRYVEIEKPIVVENIEIMEKEVPVHTYEDPPIFQEIAIDVANNHDYDLQNFNCEDFSSELAHKLALEGYKATIIRGTLKNCNPEDDMYNCPHAWVRVEVNIEATDGTILDPDFYEENYKD